MRYFNNQIKMANDKKPFILKGIPSSPGMYMGNATVFHTETVIIPHETIPNEEIDSELNKFQIALEEVNNEYEKTIDKIDPDHFNVASVLETNLMLINDEALIHDIRDRINGGYSAESSITHYFDYQKQFFLAARDSIIRERAFEIENIKERLLSALKHSVKNYELEEGTIVVAKTITPTDLVNFREAKVAGIITEIGGITAHCSILARSFEIPAVIGVKDASSLIQNGDTVIINGYSGWTMINPGKKAIANYQLRRAIAEEHRARLGELKSLKSETKDGKAISIMSNIDSARDLENAAIVKSDGVGLVRTESLIMILNHFPNENEQYKWYSLMADRAYPEPITFRAFDIGSDKYSEGIPKHESNPALGFRGIRFLLHRKDIFKSQIRAILRTSKNKNVKFMLPMIINIYEIEETKRLINECKEELKKNGEDFDTNMPIGIMIETPSAAILSDSFAKHVQFFSIGTNDLTQYTLAADRTNDLVIENFDSFHPAVLKLIYLTAQSGLKAGISVSVCGEIAGHSAATNLLIGMGIKELSVSPAIHLELKKRVRESYYEDSVEIARKVLACETPAEVMSVLSNNIE